MTEYEKMAVSVFNEESRLYNSLIVYYSTNSSRDFKATKSIQSIYLKEDELCVIIGDTEEDLGLTKVLSLNRTCYKDSVTLVVYCSSVTILYQLRGKI